VDRLELVVSAYWYRVEVDHKETYDGKVAADAMAAWSKAVGDEKAEYICFETLRSPDEQLREKTCPDTAKPDKSHTKHTPED
jgi:hypothetical protein